MKISIIIPCRNEKQYILECIKAIYANTILEKHEIEVLVIDGISTDGTREILNQHLNKYKNLRIIDNPKQVTPIAFNLGLEHAKGEFYQIIGARHIVCKNYLEKSLTILEENKEIWCVGSKLINEFTNAEGEIISKAMDTPFGMGVGNFRVLSKSGFTDTVTSPMYPMWVFDRIGMFDENLVRNQDDDFNFRVTQAGGKIWFEHSIWLKYYVRSTFAGLKKQFFQYGYWKVFVNQKHKAITTIRQLFPPALVIFAFISLPIFLLFPFLASIVVLVWIVYFALASYFAYSKAKSLTSFVGVFRSFLILHFQYGAGYLKGIWHFILMKKNPSQKEKELSR